VPAMAARIFDEPLVRRGAIVGGSVTIAAAPMMERIADRS
jgi:hypothetical protein